MECPSPTILVAFLSGELSRQQCVEIEQHVRSCATCRDSAGRLEDSLPKNRTRTFLTPAGSADEQNGDEESVSDESFQVDTVEETIAAATHPHHIGKYEVLRLVGHGGFADVYLARHPQLEELVALKVPRAGAASERQVAAFVREARTAANLRHPNIVSIRDVDTDADGQPYVVMDWMEGGTLEQVRHRKLLPVEEIVSIMTQVAEAASSAHEAGFVHRDLKPSNILFDKYGRPHIADFGLAIHERELSERQGEFAGTRRFMSPEQVRRDTAAIDGRCDVWALGVILYLLMTSEYPFAGIGQELEQAILETEPAPPKQHNPRLPDEMQSISLTCLAKNLDKRLPSAAALVERLQAFNRKRASQRSRRKFLLGAAAVLTTGALASFGGFWIYDQNRRIRVEQIYRTGTADWHYDWDGNVIATIPPSSYGSLMLACGSAPNTANFKIEIELDQLDPKLGISLYLGYRDGTFYRFFLRDTDGNFVVERRRVVQAPGSASGDSGIVAASQTIGPLKDTFGPQLTVVFEVVEGRLNGVQFAKRRCPNLEDAQIQGGPLVDPGGYAGQFGIATSSGSARVVRAEVHVE